MAKMNIKIFEELFKLFRQINPFTLQIDSYSKQVEAEKANNQIVKKINKMLANYSLSVSLGTLPYGVDITNTIECARDSLITWLNENDIEISYKRMWTEEEIKDLIQTNDKVLYGALKKLYAEQTADEKNLGETTHNNGVGFNGYDGPFLSSVAEFVTQRGFLTPKQKELTRKKLEKYTKQLTKLANT